MIPNKGGDVRMNQPQTEALAIRNLRTEEEWREAFAVMGQLRTHLDEEEYVALVRECKEKEQYQLAALEVDHSIKAVVGFQPMVTLYNGHFVWVCDLITDESERSKGYGKALLSYVHEWAKEIGVTQVSLSSGVQRKDAHRFYKEKMNYLQVSYVFTKKFEF
jgi:GNAT superfamily N-acetyltransferase